MNVPDEYLHYLPTEVTFGKGAFREVQVLVDGQLAGIVIPYPVFFTGAYVPAVSGILDLFTRPWLTGKY
jgi:hypothetical protein